MLMLATLQRSGGLDALARKLDMSPPMVLRGAGAFLPFIAGGFRRLLDGPNGQKSRGLAAVLAQWGGAKLALGVLGPDPLDEALGQRVVAALLGPDEVVEQVMLHARARADMRDELARALLPGLALLLSGYVAARLETIIATGGFADVEMERVLASVGADNPLEDLLSAGPA